MPPVTKTSTPAAAAATMVPATVVAPTASPPAAATTARSRRLHLRASRPVVATRCSSASARPTRTRPPSTATVAGTAPPSRTMASTSRAVSRLAGYGMPWLMIVDSSATTGAPRSIASATSSLSVTSGGSCGLFNVCTPDARTPPALSQRRAMHVAGPPPSLEAATGTLEAAPATSRRHRNNEDLVAYAIAGTLPRMMQPRTARRHRKWATLTCQARSGRATRLRTIYCPPSVFNFLFIS